MTREQYLKIGKTHHLVPVFVYGSLALLMMVCVIFSKQVSTKNILLLFFTGFFSWTLVEYLLHRFPFHYVTEKEPWKLLMSGFHLLHHEIPNRGDYVVAPMIMSFPMYLLILALFRGISGNISSMALLGSGLAFGYLVYEWIHYFAHHGVAKTSVGRYLKRHHLIHHFKDSHNYFGVSSPFWDLLFGTLPQYDSKNETTALPIFSRGRS